MANRTKFWVPLLVAKSAQDVAAEVPADVLPQATEVAVYVAFGAGTNAGTVLVEGAHVPNYAGTWALLGTVAWAAANRSHLVAITGAHRALRTRISVAVTGGTVDSYALGN